MNRGLPLTGPSRATPFRKRVLALLALAALFVPYGASATESPKPLPKPRLPFLRRYVQPSRTPNRVPGRPTPAKRSTSIVIETDPDYEPEGSVPPKLPFLRRYAKRPATPNARRAPAVSPSVPAPPIRRPAAAARAGPPPPYAASPASPPTTTKHFPLDPSRKPGQKDPNRSIKLDMTRPYLR